MYEDDLKILDNQISKYLKLLKESNGQTAKDEYGKKLQILYDMRMDVLIQIKHFEGK